MTFKIESLNISDRKGIQKHPVQSVHCRENHGIEGDAHAGPWHRQVSLLAGEDVDTMQRATDSIEIGPGDFGENIVTRGIDWACAEVGGRIQIGSVVMELTQLGKECHHHCAIYDAVGDCIMPRKGIFARILEGGELHVGDSGHYSI